MNGTVNESQIAPVFQESLDGLGTSMRRTVVDDPEDPSGLAVGTTPHDLIHEAIEGGDATAGFATTEDLGAVDIQGSQVGPGPEPLVSVLDSHGAARLCGPRRTVSEARLDSGLFVGTQNELIASEFTALPDALIEIEEPARLLREVWVSRKDPATVLPRADGVLMEPAPDGGVADGGRQTRVESMFRILPAW